MSNLWTIFSIVFLFSGFYHCRQHHNNVITYDLYFEHNINLLIYSYLDNYKLNFKNNFFRNTSQQLISEELQLLIIIHIKTIILKINYYNVVNTTQFIIITQLGYLQLLILKNIFSDCSSYIKKTGQNRHQRTKNRTRIKARRWTIW